MEKHEELGRYLNGWKHLENFEFYTLKYPKATIEDYKREVTSPCTLDNYFQLARDRMIADVNDPFLQYSFRELSTEMKHWLDDKNNFEAYLDSEEFYDKTKEEFEARIRERLQEGKDYELLDALEDFTNNEPLRYDLKHLIRPTTGNAYIPPKHNILRDPDFSTGTVDDLQIRKLEKRFSEAVP